MARIQVLPLPTSKVGSMEHTPFVLIIDRAGEDVDKQGLPKWGPVELESLNESFGVPVLVVDGELTVANVDQVLHEAAQAAVLRVLCPERVVEAG